MTVMTDVQTVRAMLKVAAHKDARVMLNALYVDAQAGAIVATDGHILAALPAEVSGELSYIVPRDVLESAVTKAKPTADVLIQPDRVECAGRSVSYAPPDMRYPEWRRIVPRETSGELAHFDPEQLLPLARALKVGATSRYVTIQHNGGSAAVVFPSTPTGAFGVIMPLRPLPRGESALYDAVTGNDTTTRYSEGES